MSSADREGRGGFICIHCCPIPPPAAAAVPPRPVPSAGALRAALGSLFAALDACQLLLQLPRNMLRVGEGGGCVERQRAALQHDLSLANLPCLLLPLLLPPISLGGLQMSAFARSTAY